MEGMPRAIIGTGLPVLKYADRGEGLSADSDGIFNVASFECVGSNVLTEKRRFSSDFHD